MKTYQFSVAVLISVLLTAGCANVSPVTPLTGPLAKTQQFKTKDGSPVVEFTPPQGQGWYVANKTQRGLITYGKKLSGTNNTVVAYAFVADNNQQYANANEFLEFVKKERAKGQDEKQSAVLIDEQRLGEGNKALCVKFHYKSLVIDSERRKGEPTYLEGKGYTCQHPTKPHLITIEYSQRSKAPLDDPELVAEGESFINSLILN
jgi:hypothetical protein